MREIILDGRATSLDITSLDHARPSEGRLIWEYNVVQMNRYLLISIGAVLGANARYLVGLWAVDRFGAGFPYGTLLVNVTGSFVLGFLIAALEGRLPVPSDLRFLIGVGFLGAYTTFSSFAVESLILLRDGNMWTALVNVFGNNLAGLGAAFLGFILARWIG